LKDATYKKSAEKTALPHRGSKSNDGTGTKIEQELWLNRGENQVQVSMDDASMDSRIENNEQNHIKTEL